MCNATLIDRAHSPIDRWSFCTSVDFVDKLLIFSSISLQYFQLNHVTSWLDANFVYGVGNVWANSLRAFTGGMLLSHNATPGYPALNKIGLPLVSYTTTKDNKPIDQKKLWSKLLIK